MQKMRTISQAYEYLKLQDPETAITKTAFRRFINKGWIPVVVVGETKKLINLEDIDNFLSGKITIETKNENGIRRIRA